MADKTPSLNVLSGPLAGQKLVIEDAVDNILIGSDPSCGFVLDTPGVSPIHARLWIDLNGATIHDTNSPRGVYVNDDRVVKEAPLRNGDILWLGPPGEEGSVLIQCILPTGAAAPPPVPMPAAEPASEDTGRTIAFGIPAYRPDEPELEEVPPPAAEDQSDIDSTVVMSSGQLLEEAGLEVPEPTGSYVSHDAAALVEDAGDLEVVDEPAPPAPMAQESPSDLPADDLGFPDFDVEPTAATAPEPTVALKPEPVAPPPPAAFEPPPYPPTPPAPMFDEDLAETIVDMQAPVAPPAEFEEETAATVVDYPAPPILTPPPAAAMPPPVAAPPFSAAQEFEESGFEEAEAATVIHQRTEAPEPPPAPTPPPAAPAAAIAAPEPSPQQEPTIVTPAPVRAAAPTAAPAVRVAPPAPPPSPAAAAQRPAAEARPSAARPSPPPAAPSAKSVGPPPRVRAERPVSERPPVPPAPPAAVPSRGGGSGRGALMAAAGVVIAALAFAGYWFMRSPAPAPVAQASPAAAPVAPAETLPPAEAAAPGADATAAATPEPAPVEPTPAEAVAAPVPEPVTPRAASPSPRVAANVPPPGQRPGAVTAPGLRPGATPPPRPRAGATAAPAPAPNPAQQAAAAVSTLMTQAQAAVSSKNYDAAVAMYDEVLKLDPRNGPATAGRTAALSARNAARRTFVPGRTVVRTEQKAKGPAGFDSADVVTKNPDFLGRLDLAMNPATVKPGDRYRLQVALVNEGKKPIKISGMTFSITVNGQKTGNTIAPKIREVAPQQRAVLEELPGVFPEATTWMAEVMITANKGDSLKNQITWK